MQCLCREAGLQVERSVDDAASELTSLNLGNEILVLQGEGEELLVHFLRAVDQTHAGLLDAHVVAGLYHVAQLLLALGGRGVGNDGGVGEEEEVVVTLYLGTGQVCQHAAFGQNARLLVQDGVQQVVGVEQTLLQHVGLALAHQCHGLAGSVVGVVGIYVFYVPVLCKYLSGFGCAANEDGIDEPLVKRTADSILR